MAQVSFDNGCNWYDPANDPEDLEEVGRHIEEIGMDIIAGYMDNETCERCVSVSDAETDAEWLADYLRMAKEDLIIG
jgi:hypothetical protein